MTTKYEELLHALETTYRKILKISPGAYIFQRPFLRGLFLEGPTFGGAYLRREICVSKIDWASLIVGSKFTVFALCTKEMHAIRKLSV